nr:MAG TPA: hypothetical protein [Caudoviricetes sp.]
MDHTTRKKLSLLINAVKSRFSDDFKWVKC